MGVTNSQKGRRRESMARKEYWSSFLQNLKVFLILALFQKY
jgi:hypothetical protein